MNFTRAMRDIKYGYVVKRKGMPDVVGMMITEGLDLRKNYVGAFKTIDAKRAYKKYIITEEDLQAIDWIDAEEDDLEWDPETT